MKICAHCGKQLVRKKSLAGWEKADAFARRKFCDMKCWGGFQHARAGNYWEFEPPVVTTSFFAPPDN